MRITGVCFFSDAVVVLGILESMDSDSLYFPVTKKCMASLPGDSSKVLVQFQGDKKEFLCDVIVQNDRVTAVEYYGDEADNFFQGLLAKGRSCFDCGSLENLRQCPKCSGVNTMCLKCLTMDKMCRDCRSTELMYRSRHQDKQTKKKKRKSRVQNNVTITQTKAWKRIRKELLS